VITLCAIRIRPVIIQIIRSTPSKPRSSPDPRQYHIAISIGILPSRQSWSSSVSQCSFRSLPSGCKKSENYLDYKCRHRANFKLGTLSRFSLNIHPDHYQYHHWEYRDFPDRQPLIRPAHDRRLWEPICIQE